MSDFKPRFSNSPLVPSVSESTKVSRKVLLVTSNSRAEFKLPRLGRELVSPLKNNSRLTTESPESTDFKVPEAKEPSIFRSPNPLRVLRSPTGARRRLQNPDFTFAGQDQINTTTSLTSNDSHEASRVAAPFIFSPNCEEIRVQNHVAVTAQAVKYATSLLKKGPSPALLSSKMVTLPTSPSSCSKKTLVLSLEDTLVHSCRSSAPADFTILVTCAETGKIKKQKIQKRPFLQDFLSQMAEIYEIVLFSGKSEDYVTQVVEQIDPKKQFFSQILHRGHCFETKNGLLIKDLRLLQNRDLKNVVMVDHLMHSFSFQVDNGIPVLGFHGETGDEELKFLGKALKECSYSADVRDFLVSRFKLRELQPVLPLSSAVSH